LSKEKIMNVPTVIAVVGGIALLIGIFGGGIEAERIKIPIINSRIRVFSTITGIVLIAVAVLLSAFSPAQLSTTLPAPPSQPPSTEIATETEKAPTETLQVTQTATCGTLKLDAIRPLAILENEIREYKLIGSGFCGDTAITVSVGAFVGNNPNVYPNSQPIEVSSDGTWITVYIKPISAPDQNGLYVNVENPDGNYASLFVGFQR
jgi:hypothetical protein